MECYTKSEELNVLPQFSTRYQQPSDWLNSSNATNTLESNNKVSGDAAMSVNDQLSLNQAIRSGSNFELIRGENNSGQPRCHENAALFNDQLSHIRSKKRTYQQVLDERQNDQIAEMKGAATSDEQHMQHLVNEVSTFGNEESTMSTLSGKPSPVQLLLPRKRLKLT